MGYAETKGRKTAYAAQDKTAHIVSSLDKCACLDAIATMRERVNAYDSM